MSATQIRNSTLPDQSAEIKNKRMKPTKYGITMPISIAVNLTVSNLQGSLFTGKFLKVFGKALSWLDHLRKQFRKKFSLNLEKRPRLIATPRLHMCFRVDTFFLEFPVSSFFYNSPVIPDFRSRQNLKWKSNGVAQSLESFCLGIASIMDHIFI